MGWKAEQSVIDVIDNKNRRIGRTLAPQPQPYLIQFFWGADTYSETTEVGDCKLFIGISAVATARFLPQPIPDLHTWHADGHTGLILFGLNTPYDVVLYNGANSSSVGNAYLRARFYRYCDGDMFITRIGRAEPVRFFV
jgi:hypothetical protein